MTVSKKNLKQEQNVSSKKIPLIIFSIIVFGYAVLFLFNHNLFIKSFGKFIDLAKQITPFLLVVFVLMFLNFLFIKPATVKKYLGEQSGFAGYVYAIIAGIISVGSVYMWYPLLKDLRDRGMSNKLVAVFIYNRSVKLHLLPVMILYFGLTFTVTLTIVSVLFSLVIAFLIQKFVPATAIDK